MAHIEIQNLNFQYPHAKAPSLSSIDLQIEKGEYVVLCGESGSGKTTLLRHLKPLLTPYGEKSGEIYLDGMALSKLDGRSQASRIGFVMQDPDDQIVTDKVWHELAFGLENLGCDQKTMNLRVAEMASYFGIQDWFQRDVGTLSGGQKQLLNLASIMAMQPEILILDEPTSQLDPIAASDFLGTVKKINVELGTTILITEHRLEDIYASADRVVVMDQGAILAQGDPRQVAAELYKKKSPMFLALPAPVRAFHLAKGRGDCPLTVREGRRWLTAALGSTPLTVTEPEQKAALQNSETAISIEDGWFRYEAQGKDVLQGLDLTVPKGSITAILGGNGTGKSTTLKVLGGICRLYRGRVKILGKPIQKYHSSQLFGGILSMLPQDPKCLFSGKTLMDDLKEMTDDPRKIRDTAALCQVDHLLSSHPRDLSGGEQQRSALAKVLLTDPKILLLDEPTKGLDCFYKQKFAEVLQLLQEKRVTVLMVSHDVEFCARYAELVSLFFNGRIVTTDTPQRFFGANSFYTTAANRMSRCLFHNAVTVEDVVALLQKNQEADR